MPEFLAIHLCYWKKREPYTYKDITFCHLFSIISLLIFAWVFVWIPSEILCMLKNLEQTFLLGEDITTNT